MQKRCDREKNESALNMYWILWENVFISTFFLLMVHDKRYIYTVETWLKSQLLLQRG